MLSLECQTVYDIIRAIAGEEEVYKVVEADEISMRLPSALVLDKVKLASIIRELKDRGYIFVKYFTPDEYCLSVVKRIENKTVAVPAQEQTSAKEQAGQVVVPQKTEKQKSGVVVSKVGAFFSALLGSLIGSAIVAIVTVLIVKFVL